MTERDDKKAAVPAPVHSDDSRRDFLKTVGLGGLSVGLGAVVAAPAVAYVAFPLGHATVSGADGFVKVGKLDAFKPGQPTKVDVFADKRDAWNRIIKVKVGSAWVVREGDKLRAYSTVCPHLGCAVDYDGDATKFKCPCHKSVFTVDGKVEGGPAPRPMDELELEEKDGLVAVRYRRFRQGIADKETI
jgi:quinol---cytochrome c reductase iron-sulfur subunit, bacillus type